jgi:hypothetical protein
VAANVMLRLRKSSAAPTIYREPTEGDSGVIGPIAMPIATAKN